MKNANYLLLVILLFPSDYQFPGNPSLQVSHRLLLPVLLQGLFIYLKIGGKKIVFLVFK